jgi:hypothetical protein
MADDGIGLAEVLVGLEGFRVLEVVETAVEVIVTVETTADFTGWALRGPRRGPGPSPGPHPRSVLLRAASAAGVDQAPLALPRHRL